MTFIYLEKTSNKAMRAVLWWEMPEKGMKCKYKYLVRDMHRDVNVKMYGGAFEEFSVMIGLQRGPR